MSGPENPKIDFSKDSGRKGEVTPRHEAALKQIISRLTQGFPGSDPSAEDERNRWESVLGPDPDLHSQRRKRSRAIWEIIKAYERIEGDLGEGEYTETQMKGIEVGDFVIMKINDEYLVYAVNEVERDANTKELERVVLHEAGTEAEDLAYSAKEFFDQLRQVDLVVKPSLLDKHRKK